MNETPLSLSLSSRIPAVVLSVVKHDYIALAVDRDPRFCLVAVADDPNQPDWVHARNQEFADRLDIPYLQDLATVLAKHEPQVAIVSSQAERHSALAVEAAKAGLHIIVDKPMSTRLDECLRLVAAVKAAGVACLVWNRSLLPAILKAKEVVATGAIGPLRAIHCDFYFAKDAGPPKGARSPGEPPINWLTRQIEAHADGSDGGVGIEPMGELQVEGIYPLAYLRMITQRRVHHVFARAASHFHQAHADNRVDDLATVTLHLEDDIIGSLCIGRIGAASHPDLGEIKLHIQGRDGSLVINESRPEVSLYYRGQPAGEAQHLRVADENNQLLLDNFVNAIATGDPTILDAHGGAEICAVVEACLRSSKSGQLEAVEFVGDGDGRAPS